MNNNSDHTLICETNVAWPFWFKYGPGAGRIAQRFGVRWWTPKRDRFGNYVIKQPLRSTRVPLILNGACPVCVPGKQPADWPADWPAWENAGIESWKNAAQIADAWFAWHDQALPTQRKGCYLSAGRVQSADSKWCRYYPQNRVPVEEIPQVGAWGVPLPKRDEWLVNLDNRLVAEAFAERFIQASVALKRRYGVGRMMGDNLGHPTTGIGYPWRAACDHMQRIAAGLAAEKMVFWPNFSGCVELFPDADLDRLLETGIEGFNSEMMGHHAYRDLWDTKVTDFRDHPIYHGIANIRRLLAGGLGISVQAVANDERDGTPIDRDQFARFMAGHLLLIRRPGDAIFLSRAWWQLELADADGDPIAYWPGLLGAPTGEVAILPSGDLGAVWGRGFEHGYVRVNYRAATAEVTLR